MAKIPLQKSVPLPLKILGEESKHIAKLSKVPAQQRESLRHEVLEKALKEYPDRSARPVTAYSNFDKMSGAWLLALPGSLNGLSSAVFAEAMCAHLCLPSPAVVGSS